MSDQPDLFGEAVDRQLAHLQPLAARMRPREMDDVLGQGGLLAAGGFLRGAIAADRVPSLVLFGPPGSGKTTLARVIAGVTTAEFEELSAVSASLAEVRAVIARARDRLVGGRRTVLFLDEIHRFNKAQQDALLPAVEDGVITLIGATTENPYYEVNAALLSRTRVMRLEPLDDAAMRTLIDRALAAEAGLAGRVALTGAAREEIVARSGGDARHALNLLEAVADAAGPADAPIAAEAVATAAGGRSVVYDRAGDAHYDTISAFIKSLRGSDPDAAIYYLACMLRGGEDPKYIARRLLVAASEDIGNADPQAIVVAAACTRAVEFVGLPEARIALAQATTYLALAPKSNAAYLAIDAALAHVERHGPRRPPLALRDASRLNARNLGHGQGYRYPHDAPDAVIAGSLLPEGLAGEVFYGPTERGPEGELAARLARLRKEAEDPPASD